MYCATTNNSPALEMITKWITLSGIYQGSTPLTGSNMPLTHGDNLLAHGAAVWIWLVDGPETENRKCVLKVVRVSLDVLKTGCNPNGPRTAEQLGEEVLSAFRSKIDQWGALAHDNLVRILDSNGTLGLRVEYLPHGSASQYLTEHPHDSISLRKRMANCLYSADCFMTQVLQIGDVLAGLSYLHSRNPPVVHGHIRKLFVDIHSRTKIGGFGLASLVDGFEACAGPISQDDQIRWWSPELLRVKTPTGRPAYATASDIWALGCTLFGLLSRCGTLTLFEPQLWTYDGIDEGYSAWFRPVVGKAAELD
ncbi:kinase-like domain-containing protein [Rhizoctonia solani]|nr:kinase-like domain-containing protein [Rhizoctonia solani]